MQHQKSPNPFPNPGSYVDSGWVDIEPAAAASDKGFITLFGNGSRWAQYRLYPDGRVLIRGSIQHNSSTFASGALLGTLPLSVVKGQGERVFFPNNIIVITDDGDVRYYGAGASGAWLDGIVFTVDP